MSAIRLPIRPVVKIGEGPECTVQASEALAANPMVTCSPYSRMENIGGAIVLPEPAADFVHTIYIAASVDQVWNELSDDKMTRAYWKHESVSDWKVGSRWEHVGATPEHPVDICGEVLEVDPPHRLLVSWAFPHEANVPAKVSRVTFELTPLGPDTKLVVIHSGLEPNSDMQCGVTDGWPAVVSNLKTLLKMGKVFSDEQWKSVEA